MDKTKAIIAVVAVVVLVAAGSAVVLMSGGNGDGKDVPAEARDVTVTDSLGNQVTLVAPITSFCTVNTNAAKFFQILGLSDRIVGVDDDTKNYLDAYDGVASLGDYKNPNGEKIVQTGAKVIISQSSSRSLSAATEQSLKDNYGITVLRLDCYGENMMRDVQELLKLLGSDSAEKAFGEFKAVYDGVVGTVLEKASAVEGDPSFLFLFASMSSKNGTYYNENSELGKIAESIHGHNALVDMGVTSTSSTSKPSNETVFDYDQEGKLDFVFIRGTQGKTAEEDYRTFIGTGGGLDFSNLNVVKANRVFVIDTDVLSGPTDYIGYVCIAQAFGIDTGYDAKILMDEFEERYGFNIEYDYLMKQFPSGTA